MNSLIAKKRLIGNKKYFQIGHAHSEIDKIVELMKFTNSHFLFPRYDIFPTDCIFAGIINAEL